MCGAVATPQSRSWAVTVSYRHELSVVNRYHFWAMKGETNLRLMVRGGSYFRGRRKRFVNAAVGNQ